ncbi:MAG: fibronectin type III domain-containing protein, partial [Mariniphaga sp.]
MKTIKILAVIFLVLVLFTNAFSQNIGVAINSDGSAPNNSSILDVSSATKGFLPPRMTNAQKLAIASPATGLIVWCSNCGPSGELQIFNGTLWINTIGGVAAGLTPGAPTIGTATAGTAQATVVFTAPASNGGSAITSYTATSSPGGFTGTLSQAGSGTITITGLAVGTAYTFTVTATAASGTGPASAASNSVTPVAVAPGAPTNVIATAGDKQATVTFTAPASNGGSAITSYTVNFVMYGLPGTLTQTGSGPIIITELLNGTAITFTVK